MFLDADDRLLPEALEVGLGCFEAHPECALVAGYHTLIEPMDPPLARSNLPATNADRPPRHIGGDIYLNILSRKHHIIPGTVMYRRFVFESVGYFDPEVKASEDYDLYFRVARRFPVYCHDTMVLENRKHSANMTRDHGKMLKATLEVLRSQRGTPRGTSAIGRRTGPV